MVHRWNWLVDLNTQHNEYSFNVEQVNHNSSTTNMSPLIIWMTQANNLQRGLILLPTTTHIKSQRTQQIYPQPVRFYIDCITSLAMYLIIYIGTQIWLLNPSGIIVWVIEEIGRLFQILNTMKILMWSKLASFLYPQTWGPSSFGWLKATTYQGY